MGAEVRGRGGGVGGAGGEGGLDVRVALGAAGEHAELGLREPQSLVLLEGALIPAARVFPRAHAAVVVDGPEAVLRLGPGPIVLAVRAVGHEALVDPAWKPESAGDDDPV